MGMVGPTWDVKGLMVTGLRRKDHEVQLSVLVGVLVLWWVITGWDLVEGDVGIMEGDGEVYTSEVHGLEAVGNRVPSCSSSSTSPKSLNSSSPPSMIGSGHLVHPDRQILQTTAVGHHLTSHQSFPFPNPSQGHPTSQRHPSAVIVQRLLAIFSCLSHVQAR